jgi:2,3-diaminopropionate biosynthesis protein SbnB
MHDDGILILKSEDVTSLLDGREQETIDAVRKAYLTHGVGDSSLPHSNFLRFPREKANRIIALPAYLGGEFDIAGIKWIASFPANITRGMDRASAVIILNCPETGRPRAIIEGATISARRTAASAALAAKTLQHEGHGEENQLGIIGCGLISFEIVRFALTAFPGLRGLVVYDTSADRAERFKRACLETFKNLEVETVGEARVALGRSLLVAIATTATEPHISDLSVCAPGSTILHISLRDLTPDVILSCDNVVDDIDHVCRAQTSAHLAEQMVGNRDFIRCSLADILSGRAAGRSAGSISVFSPFGLGTLDLAVSKLVYDLALQTGRGQVISSFLPVPWNAAEPGKGREV